MFLVPFLHDAGWFVGLAGNHIQISGVNKSDFLILENKIMQFRFNVSKKLLLWLMTLQDCQD